MANRGDLPGIYKEIEMFVLLFKEEGPVLWLLLPFFLTTGIFLKPRRTHSTTQTTQGTNELHCIPKIYQISMHAANRD